MVEPRLVCPICSGSGSYAARDCFNCAGIGKMTPRPRLAEGYEGGCGQCSGTGYTCLGNRKCEYCQGLGYN